VTSDIASARTERDALGPVAVPADALHGPQTARAIANFTISGIPIGHFADFIRAFAYVKKAAARANGQLGRLAPETARVIAEACDEIIAGRHMAAFPVDVFQGGAGTSSNMNMNEVIANLALDRLGLQRGRYDVVHPNDHVNLSQSTNDAYPTALRIAILFAGRRLRAALLALAQEFEARAREFAAIRKLGRTQLQDAVPMTLGDELAAFASTLRADVARFDDIAAQLTEVNLGGTAIGTGVNAPSEYRRAVVAELADLTQLPLQPAADLIEASWDTGALVLYSGMLKRTATKLSKIANDLRLLSSGPRGGIGEIGLPALQPGSSIMPGKVNPVIPELVNQVAFQVIGADLVVTLASEAAQLQLNAMEPVILYNILSSIDLMTGAVDALTVKCIRGMTASPDTCLRHLERSTATAAELVPVLGYERASRIALDALATGRTIAELLSGEAGAQGFPGSAATAEEGGHG
jgi:aspartate ammonia-lyase